MCMVRKGLPHARQKLLALTKTLFCLHNTHKQGMAHFTEPVKNLFLERHGLIDLITNMDDYEHIFFRLYCECAQRSEQFLAFNLSLRS